MRKLIEKVLPADTTIILQLETSDGLVYSEEVAVTDNHKEFENNLKAARSKLTNKRVWLNARKALTVAELKQLDTEV